MRLIDLTGNRYGKLVVLSRHEISSKSGSAKWVCKCDCGNTTIVDGSDLRRNHITACGCERKKRNGKSTTRLYNIWNGMLQRCFIVNSKYYMNYGGRGISVCDEWMDFNNFEKWALTNGYRYTLSIDRINNDGNYEPSNCRWATIIEQANNMRSNHLLTYKGKTLTLTQWANNFGINAHTLDSRLRNGWDIHSALTTPTDTRYSVKRKDAWNRRA